MRWGGESWGHWPAERPRKKWSECMMEDMNLLGVEEHATAGSTDVEGSHRPPNPILDGKMLTSNENDDDDDDDDDFYFCLSNSTWTPENIQGCS